MATIDLHGNPPMKAGGNISPCRFVKLSANQTLVQCSGNSDVPFGISADGQRTPPGFVNALSGVSETPYHAISGDPVEYFGLGQYGLLECGTAWSAGAKLMSDASGKGLTATSTNPVGARALTDASAGELALVRVSDGQPNT